MKTQELIDKYLSFDKTSLQFASVEYFARSGKISGELHKSITAMLNDAAASTIIEYSTSWWTLIPDTTYSSIRISKTQLASDYYDKN